MIYEVDEIKIEPQHKEGVSKRTGKPYSFWSMAVLIEGKWVWINGEEEYLKGIDAGSKVEGVLTEEKYMKDGEEKTSYKLSREGSQAHKDEQLKSLGEEFNKLAQRVSKLEEIVWPE